MQADTQRVLLQLLRHFEHLDSKLLQFPLRVNQLIGSAKSLFLFALHRLSAAERPTVVITPSDHLELWMHDGESLATALNLPLLFYTSEPPTLSYRLEEANLTFLGLAPALTALLRSDAPAPIIVVPITMLSEPVPPPEQLQAHLLPIAVGATLSFEDFIGILALQGYNRKEFVEIPGEFAVRGGIVDVFPPDSSAPIRIEFFGDEIESIRLFDPRSQRSIRPLQQYVLLSALHFDIESPATLRSYIPLDSLIVLDTPALLWNETKDQQREEFVQLQQLSSRIVELNPTGTSDITFQCSRIPAVQSSIQQLWHQLQQLSQEGYTIFLTADTAAALRRLRDLLEEFSESEIDEPRLSRVFPTLQWLPIGLSKAFYSETLRIAVIPEQHIFQRTAPKQRRTRGGMTLNDLDTLNKGDFVVHVDKGIAIFDGLTTIEVGGQPQECVRLIFAGNDVVYLNTNYLHKLQKYSATEDIPPRLTRLGTREWERKKAKAKSKLRDMAKELIELYARRKASTGFAYPADTIWQKEMEAAFPFEDTPDQAKATEEVKRDMESPTPMDRLICGDVGFGKTEVAIRAAFKAVQAGKQVAVLVPTTILALQHYETFRDRLSAYPVEIAVLSRFRSSVEQREILRKLKDGLIDIIIGTHRLLSKDIAFRDLGLLIIDEEHRFGVAAKEKLRQLKTSVDTLLLTATPIPRTLHMALIGARDISIIATPPQNRLPVITKIIQWDPLTIREAIERELRRGGQIFFVNDRISTLPDLADELRSIAPDLRIATIHGKMPAREIERIMHRFIEKKIDLLLATKIIEAGIDIPNANTMFINRADTFGLAELYQLRGRVGRSSVQGYCYLITPPLHHISRRAVRRLQALEEFTSLGSGLNLALRDLEIRGAGNIFGAEQSGEIAEIGFEMYQKILEEAIQDLKYQQLKDRPEALPAPESIFELLRTRNELTIEAKISAQFPKDYISLESERFRYYKQLYRLTSLEQLQQLRQEIEDRYGKLPPEAKQLFDLLRLRITALPLGFSTLMLDNHTVSIEFPEDPNHPFYTFILDPLLVTVAAIPNARFRSVGHRTILQLQFHTLEDLLQQLQAIQNEISRHWKKPQPITPLTSS